MGGYVALEVLRLAQDRVVGLALLSTSARADSPQQLASRRDQRIAVGAGRFDAVVGRPDSRPDLGSIRCPTAVVHGEGDRLIAPDNGVELAEGISGARLTLVPGAGHLALQEQPAAVCAAVGAWLDALPA